MVMPPTRTISNLPFSKTLVSSGASKLFRITSSIRRFSLYFCLNQLVNTCRDWKQETYRIPIDGMRCLKGGASYASPQKYISADLSTPPSDRGLAAKGCSGV